MLWGVQNVAGTQGKVEERLIPMMEPGRCWQTESDLYMRVLEKRALAKEASLGTKALKVGKPFAEQSGRWHRKASVRPWCQAKCAFYSCALGWNLLSQVTTTCVFKKGNTCSSVSLNYLKGPEITEFPVTRFYTFKSINLTKICKSFFKVTV